MEPKRTGATDRDTSSRPARQGCLQLCRLSSRAAVGFGPAGAERPLHLRLPTLTEPFQERELETALVRHLEKFPLELGQGFAFVGRQFRLDVGDDDFHLDLLFYHLRLRAFVVINLKKGTFKPEYAGKLNFYCNVVNDRLKHVTDAPTIGLILCQTQDRLLVEYSFSTHLKPCFK